MKKLVFCICLLLTAKSLHAQKDSLAFDDSGKYIYYKVAGSGHYSADEVYQKSTGFIKAKENADLKLITRDVKNMGLSGSGIFMVYKPSLAKHPEGQITYRFKIEVKDAKYRYWLTDFVYTPYFKDRYNNYVPKPGIAVPLEKKSTNLDETDKSNYLNECAAFAIKFGERLKKYLSQPGAVTVKKDTSRKVIHFNSW